MLPNCIWGNCSNLAHGATLSSTINSDESVFAFTPDSKRPWRRTAMNPLKATKAVLIGGWILGLMLWATSSSWSKVSVVAGDKEKNPPATAKDKDDQYVGSETCQTCHEDQFKNFAHTAHMKLESLS